MNGRPVTKADANRIVKLRKTGHSLPEIRRIVKRGNSTVMRYIRDVKVLSQYAHVLKAKQGASRERSRREWELAQSSAQSMFSEISGKAKILIAASLYWGEGAKNDFSFSNTDPGMIKVLVSCLEDLGISKERLKVTIRIYDDINKNKAINYWSSLIGVPRRQILNVNVLRGKKRGKLKYGMCRIRITKGGFYFKLIQSIIELMKQRIIGPS